METSLVAQVQLNMKAISMTVSHSRSSFDAFLCHIWRKYVPHSGTCCMWGQYAPASYHGAMRWYWFEKRWNSVLLHGLPQTQYVYQEGFIPAAMDTRSAGKHGGCCTFFNNGFKSRFWQVKMAPESQQYTTFSMENLGFYKFTYMPFGLCNVLVTFQCLMQNTLGELNLTYCIIYLKDVIVFGHTEEEHLEHLHIPFEIETIQVFIFFNQRSCTWHIISHEGICPSKEKVRVVDKFPMPETFTQVRTFCGLVGHYRCLIKGFAHILKPLYDVLGKEVKMGPVQLPPEAWEAVRILKDKIQSAPMLVFPDFDRPFLLETNASKEGLGAVLSQKKDDWCTTPSCLGVIPSHHQRKATTALK